MSAIDGVVRGLTKDKRLKQLARAADAAGWRVEVTKGQHVRWVPPDKDQPVIITALTSETQADYQRVRKGLARAGVTV
jgi:predicted RNA binding protein YcfA (HicA-like mRNA interferase family)